MLHFEAMRVAHGITMLLVCTTAGCGSTIIEGQADSGMASDVAPDDCTPGSPAGACSVIDQCGCREGLRCVWYLDDVTCRLFEGCGDTDGVLEVGSECGAGSPVLPVLNWPCRPEASCLTSDGTTYTCHEWCRDDGDCSVSGSSCTVPLDATYHEPAASCPGVPLTAPYRLCSQG